MRTHTLLERLNELRTTPSPMRHAAQALTTDPNLVAEAVAAAELDGWPDPQADIPNPLDDDATASNAPPSSTDSPPWEDEQGPGPLTTRRCDWTGCTATLVAIDLDRLEYRANRRPSPALRDLADRGVTPTIDGPYRPAQNTRGGRSRVTGWCDTESADQTNSPQEPSMTTDTAARAANLAGLLANADGDYYAGRDSGMSDAVYDATKAELAGLADADPTVAANPAVAAVLNLPGATRPNVTFAPVAHTVPMLSLDNAMNNDALDAFLARTSKAVAGARYSVTGKLDGLSLSALFERTPDGQLTLTRAATRGDGTVGEAVTAQAATIANLPTVLDGDNLPDRVEVRGEVVIRRSAFDQANAARVASGKPAFANARNAAAGSLRQKDPAVTAARPLSFIAFQVAAWDGPNAPGSDTDALAWAASVGFELPEDVAVGVGGHDVAELVALIEQSADSYDYDIDGVVVKLDNFADRDLLGATSRAPSWAIAKKPQAEVATTRLTAIEVQVGRTGRVAPYAVLEPVQVGGVTVTAATLNNPAYISAKDIRVGEQVQIVRAGEVIPAVLGPVLDGNQPRPAPYEFPTACPVCDAPLDLNESADARCVAPECPAKAKPRLVYFASRKIADIDGIGTKLIDQLLDRQLVDDPGDLLLLTADQLSGLDRMGDTSIANILTNIAAAVERLTTEPARLLASLNIRTIGRGQGRDLLAHFGTVQAVLDAPETQLVEAPGIGPERARRLADGLATDRVNDLLAKYEKAGVRFDHNPAPAVSDGDTQPLAGQTFVLTGALGRPRDTIKADLEALGAKVSGSVSAKTTALIAGDGGGSKADKAAKVGVPVIGPDELALLLTGQPYAA